MKANTVASRPIEKWNLHFCSSYLLKSYQNWQDNQTLKWNFPCKSPATQTLPVAVYSKSDEIKITINNFLWKWEISSHLDQATFFHYSFFGMNSKFSVIYWVWSCIRLEKWVIGWANIQSLWKTFTVVHDENVFHSFNGRKRKRWTVSTQSTHT